MLEGGVPYPVVASIMDWSEVSARKELAPQVGLESTCKRTFNNLQGHGWHPRTL
jgi:hypothetical protein